MAAQSQLAGTVMGLGMKTVEVTRPTVTVTVFSADSRSEKEFTPLGIELVLPGVGVKETLLHETPELGDGQIMDEPPLPWPDDRSPDDHAGDDVVGYGPVMLEELVVLEFVVLELVVERVVG
ncbi:hypothetical protein GQX73_g3208 [Xylaria multiplex]|uniref:Uncharacterized protein n=1 Tax=Xylaria multiplex TaxID=323545 RepID=A0A7C8MSI2_9PEZI|nr:hypothetical protein GQX73_g3208 [Xylaria multiplex]